MVISMKRTPFYLIHYFCLRSVGFKDEHEEFGVNPIQHLWWEIEQSSWVVEKIMKDAIAGGQYNFLRSFTH